MIVTTCSIQGFVADHWPHIAPHLTILSISKFVYFYFMWSWC